MRWPRCVRGDVYDAGCRRELVRLCPRGPRFCVGWKTPADSGWRRIDRLSRHHRRFVAPGAGVSDFLRLRRLPERRRVHAEAARPRARRTLRSARVSRCGRRGISRRRTRCMRVGRIGARSRAPRHPIRCVRTHRSGVRPRHRILDVGLLGERRTSRAADRYAACGARVSSKRRRSWAPAR